MSQPVVSIIVPNYNHEKYLDQRFESIFYQSFDKYEVIVLDDASTDHSVLIIESWCKRYNQIKKIINEKNSGSPFEQWNKGLRLAKGKFIWIAESDDYCHKDFLKKSVERLEANNNVGLVFCNSYLVDSDNNKSGDTKSWRDYVDQNHWNKSYQNDGKNEVYNYLWKQCTIPNASSVVFRRMINSKLHLADQRKKRTGDWVFYATILNHADIYYIQESLNYFRRHLNLAENEPIRMTVLKEKLESRMEILKEHRIYKEKRTELIEILFYEYLSVWNSGDRFKLLPVIANHLIVKYPQLFLPMSVAVCKRMIKNLIKCL